LLAPPSNEATPLANHKVEASYFAGRLVGTREEAETIAKESGTMNKSQHIVLFVAALFTCVAAYASRSDKLRTLSATRTTSVSTRIGVDTANNSIRAANAEAKITRDLMKKWNDESNSATDLEQLKQIAINEGPSLDSAVQHNRKAMELMEVVAASLPSSCVESVAVVYKMASEDLALEVDVKNLAIQSDISTAAGLNRFNAALSRLLARKHTILIEKTAYEGSPAFRNACGASD
jgi:hypothetical protein